MGKLDDLVLMVAQVQWRLSRGHQRREVWSGADKVTSWIQLDKFVVDKERQSQMRRKELSMLGVDRDVKDFTLYIQAQYVM